MIYSGRTTYQCHDTVTFLLSICLYLVLVLVLGARCVLHVNGQRLMEMGAQHTSTRQPISHYIKLSYYCGRFFGLNDVGCIDMNQMRTNERRSDD